jgi:hypothetical protein
MFWQEKIDRLKFKLGLGYRVEFKDFSLFRSLFECNIHLHILPSTIAPSRTIKLERNREVGKAYRLWAKPELQEWLNKNVKGEVAIRASRRSNAELLQDFQIGNTPMYTTRHWEPLEIARYSLMFERARDATLFKMTWC